MRRKIVAANWKMNLTPAEGVTLASEILKGCTNLQAHQHVAIAAPFTHLHSLSSLFSNSSNVHLAAQNCNAAVSGAYTGEVSLTMLDSVGVSAVIIGHSERRMYNHESHADLKAKLDAILGAGVMPIFCCGEPLEIREANTQEQYVTTQLEESLLHVDASQISKVVIAYEPIWAIGTGKTASSAQAQDMHAHIRSILATQYGEAVAQDVTILYGGSCNAANAQELFAQPDIDGGLIGGASLKAETFLPIVNALA